MVLCSIEEAWGSDFINPPNSTPGYSKNYVKQKQNPSRNRYRYDFSRDSAPLNEHNGSYRVQTNNRVNIPNDSNNEPIHPQVEYPPHNPRFSQQNININQQNLIDKYNYEQEENNYIPTSRQENNQNNRQVENYNTNNKIIDNDKDSYLPIEEEDEYENFQDRNYNDNREDEYDSTPNMENKFNTKIDDQDYEENDYESDNEDNSNQKTVTVNFSNLLSKVNNLLDYFEQYSKGNGNEMKDIFIFIILGIFFIFILDLIFRIGQKIKS